MRMGLISVVGSLLLASTMVTIGCGSSASGGGAGGSSSSGGVGGGSSKGGASSGSSSTSAGGSSSGTATGGSSSSTSAGGSSSNGTSVTTLDDSKTLNTLAPADTTQLCKDTYSYFNSNISMATACKYKGLSLATASSAPSDSEFQKICKDNQSACTQAGTGVGSAESPGCSGLSTKCTATIAQYAACIKDEVAAFTQGLSALPDCATATSAIISKVWEVMAPSTPPDSCDQIANKCPDLTVPAPNN
jgi:hypothetical protein